LPRREKCGQRRSARQDTLQEIQLTVAICTHNRSADLAGCLSALSLQDPSGIQLLVVDSASATDERLAIAELVGDHERVQLIRLEEPGLSRARNAALAATPAPWIAYLDDDTIPSGNWTAVALELVSNANPDCAVFGGKTSALFPAGMKPVLGRRWQQLLSIVETSGEGDRSARYNIVGANVIFRTDVLKKMGGFSTNLGRIGSSLLSGEEKVLLESIVGSGMRIWYTERLSVKHRVTPERLAYAWVRRRAYWDGVSDYKIATLLKRRLSPLWLLKVAAATLFLAILYPIASRHEFFIRFWYNVGWLHSYLSAATYELCRTGGRSATG
jgi:glycosyltransferase involved in cell wall biosynthesis